MGCAASLMWPRGARAETVDAGAGRPCDSPSLFASFLKSLTPESLMTIDRIGSPSSRPVSTPQTQRAGPPPPASESRPAAPTGASTFQRAPATPVSLGATPPSVSRAQADADVQEYRSRQAVSEEAADVFMAEKLATNRADPRYGADVVAQLSPFELNRVYGAAKVEDQGAVADAIKAGVAQGTLSQRDLERAARVGARQSTGLDLALAGTDPLAASQTQSAIATLETAKATLSAAETRLTENLAVGARLVTDDQKAAAIAAFREQNADLYTNVAAAEDALLSSLQSNAGALDAATLTEGYTALAGTRHASTALDWAAERARTHGPDAGLEGIVAASLPTVAATAAATGQPPPATFRSELEAKLAPFMDPAATVVGAASTAWDFKGTAEDLKGALDNFTALATGTAKPDDLEALGKEWNETSRLGKAIAVAGLAYDLYGAATADGAGERLEHLISASTDAAGILGGLAQAGRLGSEVLGVSASTVGRIATRFIPAMGTVVSLAYGRLAENGVTLGSTVGVAGDLISAAGSAISATGVGALPGTAITAVGTGVSIVGDGITAVTNDVGLQREREAMWRAANERLPADQRIGEETMGYLRGGIFNRQSWRDGGTGALPDLPPDVLQRAIEGGHLDALRDLEDELIDQVNLEAFPNRSTMNTTELLEANLARADELDAKVKALFDVQAPALLAELEGQ
jgi:hypothetical protein